MLRTWTWEDHFISNGATLPLVASKSAANPWCINEIKTNGTPTYAGVNNAAMGAVSLAFDNTAEVQSVCLYHGDNLNFDIDNIIQFGWRVKVGGTLDSATSIAIGMGTARNNTIESVSTHAFFVLTGANTITVDTNDGTNDKDLIATGKSLSTTYLDLSVSFASGGTSDVRFFIDGSPVAQGTTFSLAAYTGNLQPICQIQKTSDNNTDSITVDRFWVTMRDGA